MSTPPPPVDDAIAFSPALVDAARERLAAWLRPTPLVYSAGLSRLTGARVFLKMECWQVYGCFKARGVTSYLTAVPAATLDRGVATASSGNHGLALAGIARRMGIGPVQVFVPGAADAAKRRRLELAGAEVLAGGTDFYAAFDRAQRAVARTGACFVHSHAHPLVIAGQGTIGLEILDDLPDPDLVVVPVGGGGLIAGIAAAIKPRAPRVRIVGAEPESAPGAYQALLEGRPCERVALQPSLADGLQGGLSPLPFEIAHRLIDSVALVDEAAILNAMQVFLREEQLVVEGAAAVGLAALLSGRCAADERTVVLVLTGRNIAAERFLRLMDTPPDRVSQVLPSGGAKVYY